MAGIASRVANERVDGIEEAVCRAQGSEIAEEAIYAASARSHGNLACGPAWVCPFNCPSDSTSFKWRWGWSCGASFDGDRLRWV